MDTNTLITIAAMLDARIAEYETIRDKFQEHYDASRGEHVDIRGGHKNNAMRFAGSIYALEKLRDELQDIIDYNVAAIEE